MTAGEASYGSCMCELTPSSLDRLAHNLHVQVSFEPVAINLFVFGLTSCCIVTITDDSNKLSGHRNVFAFMPCLSPLLHVYPGE